MKVGGHVRDRDPSRDALLPVRREADPQPRTYSEGWRRRGSISRGSTKLSRRLPADHDPAAIKVCRVVQPTDVVVAAPVPPATPDAAAVCAWSSDSVGPFTRTTPTIAWWPGTVHTKS